MTSPGSRGVRLFATIALTLTACAPMPVVSAPEQVSPATPPPGMGNPPNAARETATTFVSTSVGAGPAAIVAGWNDGAENFAIGRSTGPNTWTSCTRRTCGPNGGPIPLAPFQAPDIDGSGVGNFQGDPAVAGATAPTGTAGSGVVVAANVVISSVVQAPNLADGIIAVVSYDAGASWQQAYMLNVGNNLGFNACDIQVGGQADQPSIAFDPSSNASQNGPSTFWIAWRGGGSLCVRSVEVDAINRVAHIGDHSRLIPTQGNGAGGVIVRASESGMLYVMYSSDSVFATQNPPAVCVPRPLTWYVTSSSDRGVSWGPSHVVLAAQNYENCLGNGIIVGGIRDFGFDVAPDDSLWAVVHDSAGSLTVRHSFSAGFMWTTSFVSPAVGGAAQPALAVNADGDVAISYYGAVSGSTAQAQRVLAFRDAASGAWTFPTPVAGSASTVPIIPPDGRRWGDYQGITALDRTEAGGADFFAIWTQTDPTSGLPTVNGARARLVP